MKYILEEEVATIDNLFYLCIRSSLVFVQL
jgi:hypothetical protein